jgi:hypothetical protein
LLPSRLLLQARWLVLSPSRHLLLLLQVVLLLLERVLLLAALRGSCWERHPSCPKPRVRQRQQAQLPNRCCTAAA